MKIHGKISCHKKTTTSINFLELTTLFPGNKKQQYTKTIQKPHWLKVPVFFFYHENPPIFWQSVWLPGPWSHKHSTSTSTRSKSSTPCSTVEGPFQGVAVVCRLHHLCCRRSMICFWTPIKGPHIKMFLSFFL